MQTKTQTRADKQDREMARMGSFLNVREEELVAPVLEEAVPAHHKLLWQQKKFCKERLHEQHTICK
jgi:hypothetical protein